MDSADDAHDDSGPNQLGFRGRPEELYKIDEDLAEELAGAAPVMIVALDGYVDAGSGLELVVRALKEDPDRATVVTFDADGLIDYRSRRPGLTFSGNAFTAYDTPHLIIERMRDATGTPFLLFTGPEPDLSWEKFCAAIGQVVDRLGIRLTIGLMAIPMGVPHTRPTGMSVHATRPEILPESQNWIGSVEVPGHVSGLLELRLGESGHDAIGFAAHVPHYLARNEYPVAARTLIDAAANCAGLVLPTDGLEGAISELWAQLAKQLDEHGEISEVVHALERQYDTFMASNGNSLLGASEPIPTADELAAQFEAYLAGQDGSES